MFNNAGKGRPICKVIGGSDDDEIIYLDPEGAKTNSKFKKSYFKDLNVKDGTLSVVPDTTRERDCIMITGASGSGKSHWCNNYMKEYHKSYKKNKIFFFSKLEEDKSIDKKLVQRVRIDGDMITNPIETEELKDSLCVFDDVEHIDDDEVKKYLFKLINSILTTGRHYNISIILVIHYPNASYTRTMLSECHSFVYFPYSATRSVNYALEAYIGIDKKEIKFIKKNIKSRWIMIGKNYPQYVVAEHNLFTLADLDI